MASIAESNLSAFFYAPCEAELHWWHRDRPTLKDHGGKTSFRLPPWEAAIMIMIAEKA